MKEYELRLKFHWFVPKGPNDTVPALVQIVAWCCPCAKPLSEVDGAKPSSEAMMVSLPMHICVTWPQ